MTDCDHPSGRVTLHHRDAVRHGSMETLNIPAFCDECETELLAVYSLDDLQNAKRTDQ